MGTFDVVEASIAQLREALQTGQATSEELAQAYLERIAAYDQSGPRLNAVVVMNDEALADARARRTNGARAARRSARCDGIPYTAKDSYLASGLTAAAGSPGVRATWSPGATPSPSNGCARPARC